MNFKLKSYYLDIRTDRKSPYGLLRRSYREDGKVKKETLYTFTGLTLQDLQILKSALNGDVIHKTLKNKKSD